MTQLACTGLAIPKIQNFFDRDL